MKKEQARGIRVFLVDDHPTMRQGLSFLLAEVGHTVCGEAGNRQETLDRIGHAGTDIALVDLSLARESGLDLIADLLDLGVKPLVYSMHEDRGAITNAFARGALGYVTKQEVGDVLLEALEQVHAGRRYLSPVVLRVLANEALCAESEAIVTLSPREKEIMSGLGRGETSGEISGSLGISARTVETYYARIIEKLGLASRNELRKIAIKWQNNSL